MGFEPMTCALRVRCSTTELPGRLLIAYRQDLLVALRPWPGHSRRKPARRDTMAPRLAGS